PPDTESERALLVGFVQKLLPAVARAAEGVSAPLHFYTYAPRGERALLDALARHFDALCAVPAFYDLLTSSPALTQPMVSLLSEEVRARLNLAPVCQNLYEVASALGFRWEDGRTDFRHAFRARVFDNRRTFMRDAATGELRADFSKDERDDVDEDAPPPFVRVESAARFGAEIPLEYAYAAWGLLREEAHERPRSQVRGFAGVTAEQIRDFALARVRAMQHVEESFVYKNKKVEKEPLDLSKLGEVEADPSEVPLSRSLEDFLLLEHHASFQERLLHLSLPPRERAEAGRTAFLRCERYAKDDEKVERAWFRFAAAEGDESVSQASSAPRLSVGDWVVLNPLVDGEGRALTGRSLVRGRLALVEELDERGAALRLLPLSFKNSPFRYRHQLFAPEAGTLYTADEMADDLNSDKFLDACRNARHNQLYRWLSDAEEGQRPRAVRPKRLRDAREIARLAARAQEPHGLTEAQEEVIGSHLEERVLVLQGPPGTGKSHTLGFAILARMLAQATPARPFRVAVLAKTHAAVSVALESVAKRRNQLLGLVSEPGAVATGSLQHEGASTRHPDPVATAPGSDLARLKLVKVCNDAGDNVPEGCGRVLPDGGEELSALEQWEMLLTEPLLVVGGTPGGLYRLVKQGASKGRAVDWSGEHFDLVVVDEASQMGLAEALTAAAFLRADGQFIAVGDHRQMPPILAHAWDAESRRDLRRARVFLSVFEYLQELGFPRVALDRSFRIPEEVADFLRRHVYAADGIDFRSANRTRLAECGGLDEEWLRAALAPEHALVVVEHGEEGSQQSNEFEAALVGR
ncbi:MAG TPA: AAA domain-containing protein, partial [Pyrinomonadaceae bacterium]|nr:AAA domain-containing protein [Pyrinomonadaceae bacterium]